MQENYLAKWLNNELTKEELVEFKNSDEYTSYMKIIEASGNLQAPDYDIDNALSALKNRNTLDTQKVIQLKPFKRFLKVAAAVAILMIGSYIYLGTLDSTFTTHYAENKEVILPDNSEILLNAESEVSFSEKKWDNKRSVTLEGEAFFKVAKGKRFTVTTDHGEVAVLGTQFNVENREGFFEVTCYEGLVSVTYKGEEKKLPAGTSFVVINGTKHTPNNTNNTIPSWMNNESSFTSVPLQFVLNEFKRQHNLEIELKNINTNTLFTGTFSNTNTELALKSISVPSKIKFKKEGDKVLFYATETP